MTVSVLIVDDDALVRAGLEMMLGQFDDLTVVGAASDGEHAIRLAAEAGTVALAHADGGGAFGA